MINKFMNFNNRKKGQKVENISKTENFMIKISRQIKSKKNKIYEIYGKHRTGMSEINQSFILYKSWEKECDE